MTTFLPEGFGVPIVLEADRFRLRPVTINDVIKDYDAVMSCRERLGELFGRAWPDPDLTPLRTLLDLDRSEKRFRGRSSFSYAVVSPDERRVLGRVHVNPSAKMGFDAEVGFWALSDELEHELEDAVRTWLPEAWPFGRVAYPGRDIPWNEWNVLPDRRAA